MFCRVLRTIEVCFVWAMAKGGPEGVVCCCPVPLTLVEGEVVVGM